MNCGVHSLNQKFLVGISYLTTNPLASDNYVATCKMFQFSILLQMTLNELEIFNQ